MKTSARSFISSIFISRGALAPVIGLSDRSHYRRFRHAYEERSVHLAAGDRLFLYSDGATEAMDPDGSQFGDSRFMESIGRKNSLPLNESINTLIEEITRWNGSEPPYDDISMVAVEVSVKS